MKNMRVSFSEMIFDLIVMSLIVMILMSCGGVGEQAETVNATSNISSGITASPTPAPTEPNQEQIEEMAVESILIVEVYRGFEFDNQRNVAIDLQFSDVQKDHDIAIYTDLDQDTKTPVNLIEQGHITSSHRYRGMLSVANEFNTLYIMRNEQLSSLVAIPISQSNTLSYYFEE